MQQNVVYDLWQEGDMGTRLRQIRRARELSQQNVADVIGVHVNTYMRWEREPGIIPVNAAYALAELFKMQINDLFFDVTNNKM